MLYKTQNLATKVVRRLILVAVLIAGSAMLVYAAPAPISLHTSVTLPVDM